MRTHTNSTDYVKGVKHSRIAVFKSTLKNKKKDTPWSWIHEEEENVKKISLEVVLKEGLSLQQWLCQNTNEMAFKLICILRICIYLLCDSVLVFMATKLL